MKILDYRFYRGFIEGGESPMPKNRLIFRVGGENIEK
jgi:hypothetical protein